MAKQETKTTEKEATTETTAKPVSTAELKTEEKLETADQSPKEVTKDGKSTSIEVNGETILNATVDKHYEGDPAKGIEKKSEGAKDMLDTQKKAEQAIQEGTSGLDAISIAEVSNGLVKDYNSDRPVYETASAANAALIASGKLSTEK